MNVLWFCNTPVGEAFDLYGIKKQPFGGWLEGLSKALSAQSDVTLTIAFCGSCNSLDFRTGHFADYVRYSKQSDFSRTIPAILERVKPDVVHIHGAEFDQHNRMLDYLDLDRTLVSIQGLKSYCVHSYLGGVEKKHLYRVPMSFIGWKRGSIWRDYKRFARSSRWEWDTLCRVRHVIGRTTWDYACALQANPRVCYHYNCENLRDAFYSDRWNYDGCTPHTIFASQLGSPIKGGHYLLRALAILKKKFPDVHLNVAGGALVPGKGLRAKMKVSAYGLYLHKLIKKLDLEGNVTFTGPLSEEKMKEQLLRCNVFASCSNIENSPNSVGEAMLLGVPCVSSCVGGVQDMLRDREEGYLYPAQEFYMLAHYIDRIFSDPVKAAHMGEKAHEHATHTHDRQNNAATLSNIYREVCTHATKSDNTN